MGYSRNLCVKVMKKIHVRYLQKLWYGIFRGRGKVGRKVLEKELI